MFKNPINEMNNEEKLKIIKLNIFNYSLTELKIIKIDSIKMKIFKNQKNKFSNVLSITN